MCGAIWRTAYPGTSLYNSRIPCLRKHLKMPQRLDQFTHRSNPNNTVDSICTYCYMTAATARNYIELKVKERSHQCNKAAGNVLPSLGLVSEG